MHCRGCMQKKNCMTRLWKSKQKCRWNTFEKWNKAKQVELFSVFFTPEVIYARHQINWHLQFTSWEIFLYLVEMECVGGSWDWDMANWQREINSVPGKLVSNHEDLLFFLNLSDLGGGLTLVFFQVKLQDYRLMGIPTECKRKSLKDVI